MPNQIIEKTISLKYHLLTLILVATITNPLHKKAAVEEIPFARTVLVDTFNLTLNKSRVTTFHRSNTEITYIGPPKPEIVLKPKADVYNYDIRRQGQHYAFAEPRDIIVFIDTSKIIGSPGPAFPPPPPPPPSSNEKGNTLNVVPSKSKNVYKRQGYLSYPIFIENLSSDTLQIGYGFHIPAIFEAQNEHGEWVSIQDNYRYKCGNGLPTPYLPKKQLLIATCPILYGDFRTKLRLKFGIEEYGFSYSNAFFGNIDRQMFEEERWVPNLY